jgi:hypothetical protein
MEPIVGVGYAGGLRADSFGRLSSDERRTNVARKMVFVSDLSGAEIEEGKSATISIKFEDARKGIYVLDVTEAEADELGRKGRKQARRGRRPKAA